MIQLLVAINVSISAILILCSMKTLKMDLTLFDNNLIWCIEYIHFMGDSNIAL